MNQTTTPRNQNAALAIATKKRYHGFQFVEVYGWSGDLTADNIERLHFHAALKPKAKVHFKDEVLTAIHEGSVGSQRSQNL